MIVNRVQSYVYILVFIRLLNPFVKLLKMSRDSVWVRRQCLYMFEKTLNMSAMFDGGFEID